MSDGLELDLYDILNLDSSCTQGDIFKAYRKLARKYHPDMKGGDADLFELITQAYDTLRTPEKKEQYDRFKKIEAEASVDYSDLKAQAQSYLKAQDKKVTKEEKDAANNAYKINFEELDRKRGYLRSGTSEIPAGDARKAAKNLERERAQEEIELAPEKLFEGGFDSSKFHALFDKKFGRGRDLVRHTEQPAAWNDPLGGPAMVADGDYEAPFAEGPLDGAYAGVDVGLEAEGSARITKEDLIGLQGADYVKGHSTISAEDKKKMASRLLERESQTDNFERMAPGDYSTDPGMGGFSIFSQLGINGDQLALEGSDLKDKYAKLLEERSGIP